MYLFLILLPLFVWKKVILFAFNGSGVVLTIPDSSLARFFCPHIGDGRWCHRPFVHRVVDTHALRFPLPLGPLFLPASEKKRRVLRFAMRSDESWTRARRRMFPVSRSLLVPLLLLLAGAAVGNFVLEGRVRTSFFKQTRICSVKLLEWIMWDIKTLQ